MRLACLAVTRKGLQMAQTLRECLDEPIDVYITNKVVPGEAAKKILHVNTFDKLEDAVKETFYVYDGLIFVMATGIVVRTIAPFLENKLTDPAVVVFDEHGRHGISLLSGHVGGANELTRTLCRALGANPVITTATDVNEKLAPDVISERLGLRPWPKVRIKTINAGLLEERIVHWRIDRTLPHSSFYQQRLEKYGQFVDLCAPGQLFEIEQDKKEQLEIVVTTEARLPGLADLPANILCMTPRRLIAGVGCRKGTPAAMVMMALDEACKMIGRDRSFIDVLASTMVKRHEAGILYAGDSLVRPVKFFDNDIMAQMIAKHHLEESEFVLNRIGIGNVCEAAAYCEAGERGGKLALRKTSFERVTVALLWEK